MERWVESKREQDDEASGIPGGEWSICHIAHQHVNEANGPAELSGLMCQCHAEDEYHGRCGKKKNDTPGYLLTLVYLKVYERNTPEKMLYVAFNAYCKDAAKGYLL